MEYVLKAFIRFLEDRYPDQKTTLDEGRYPDQEDSTRFRTCWRQISRSRR